MLTLALRPELAENFPSDAREARPVFERWRRLDHAIDGPAHPEGVDGAALSERRERLRDAFRVRQLLDSVPNEIIQAGYTALVADADGVILDRVASDPFLEAAAKVRLVCGAQWNESIRGTNAIGTALFEGVPVAVVGDAHYERVNRGLVCYAAPIRDPLGRVVAVFDVTSGVENASPLVGPLVTVVAKSLERTLHEAAFERATPGGLPSLRQTIERASDAAWLIGADGQVRAASPASPSTFDVSWDVLSKAAVEDGTMIMPLTNERFALQPIVAAEGQPIAVAAFRQPRRRVRQRPDAFARIVGSDPVLVKARSLAARFAPTDLPIMLLAESGSGKELFAKAVHDASRRSTGPFVAVNCGALSSSLLESEVFGYAPGAFTGARSEGHDGLVAEACGGTLFLDEVAEMSPALQAALLRVLEDGSYRRLGDAGLCHTDVRIVTATCRDLLAMVESGAFRNDLYFRLRGATIELPLLRDRVDTLELAEVLLDQLVDAAGRTYPPRLGATARVWIEAQAWPGNVRELKMALAHAMVLADDTIEAEHFPKVARMPATKAPTSSRDAAEATALRVALERSNGNMSEAARILGVARTTLYRMKRRHGL